MACGTLVNIRTEPLYAQAYKGRDSNGKYIFAQEEYKHGRVDQSKRDSQFLAVIDAQPDPDVKALIDALSEFWSACGSEKLCIPCFQHKLSRGHSCGCCSSCPNSSTTGCIGKGVLCTTFTCNRLPDLVPPELRPEVAALIDGTWPYTYGMTRKEYGEFIAAGKVIYSGDVQCSIREWWQAARLRYFVKKDKYEYEPNWYYVDGFLFDASIRLNPEHREIVKQYIAKVQSLAQRVRESQWKPDLPALYVKFEHVDYVRKRKLKHVS